MRQNGTSFTETLAQVKNERSIVNPSPEARAQMTALAVKYSSKRAAKGKKKRATKSPRDAVAPQDVAQKEEKWATNRDSGDQSVPEIPLNSEETPAESPKDPGAKQNQGEEPKMENTEASVKSTDVDRTEIPESQLLDEDDIPEAHVLEN
mmetsp:Transcript_42812/g.100709  ORF Transcript_42812/g.100709 Transcript_42812/m.100709 type:complete len:150 (+) Transcript_42812:110-559(+)